MKATSTLLPEATQNGQSEWNREWEWFLRDRKWMRPASLMAHIVKACNVGDLGQSLGWEDPLEKGTATHSSILAWRIPWTEKPGRLQFMGSQRARQDWATFTFSSMTALLFWFESVCGGHYRRLPDSLHWEDKSWAPRETNVLKILRTEQWRERTSHTQNSKTCRDSALSI